MHVHRNTRNTGCLAHTQRLKDARQHTSACVMHRPWEPPGTFRCSLSLTQATCLQWDEHKVQGISWATPIVWGCCLLSDVLAEGLCCVQPPKDCWGCMWYTLGMELHWTFRCSLSNAQATCLQWKEHKVQGISWATPFVVSCLLQ